MLAVFWDFGDDFSGNILVDAKGNPLGSDGGCGLQLSVEHSGIEGAGKAGGKRVVSEKSTEGKKQEEKTLNVRERKL